MVREVGKGELGLGNAAAAAASPTPLIVITAVSKSSFVAPGLCTIQEDPVACWVSGQGERQCYSEGQTCGASCASSSYVCVKMCQCNHRGAMQCTIVLQEVFKIYAGFIVLTGHI